MKELAPSLISVIYELLPGFVSAWVFYNLTSNIKPSKFERVIQALIFTTISKAILIIAKQLLFWFGREYKSFATWNNNIEFIVFLLIGFSLGVVFSWCVNNDFPHWMFRRESYKNKGLIVKPFLFILSKINLTNKTLHPTEWYSFFKESSDNYVVLHLENERRLQGYLIQYPDNPEAGHFIVANASWLLNDGRVVPLLSVDSTLIASKEVVRVEKLFNEDDVNDNINEVNQYIYDLY